MEKIRKIMAMALVVTMVCASLVIVSPNLVVAEDSANPLANLNTGFPGAIDKVAWHQSGDYALGILKDSDGIYRYTRQTSSWTVEFPSSGSVVFRDIKYSAFWGDFYIVGNDGAGQSSAWRWTGASLDNLAAPLAIPSTFDGLCLADVGGTTAYAFLAVGNDGSQPYAAWFDEVGDTWTVVSSGFMTNHFLYDVAWNQNIGVPYFYAVGEDTGPSDGVVYYWDTPGDTKAYQYTTNMTGVKTLAAIDWSSSGLGLMGGVNTAGMGYGNVWTFNPATGPTSVLNTTDTIKDISWHPDGSMAVLVGYDISTYGVIYHYTVTSDAVTKISEDTVYDDFYGVDVKGWTSPSSGLIVGFSGAVGNYISASDSGTYIYVNAAFPHMFAIDMWKTSDVTQTSTLNTQVDVEETYTFYTEVNYTIDTVDQIFDGTNNTFIDLVAWYDEGAEALEPVNDDSHRTRKFVARFFEETGGVGGVTGTMVYPDTTTSEFLFDSVGCSGPFGVDDRYAVWINVTFGPQMRAADGSGFGNGASPDIYDVAQSYNDPNSWNFYMEVYDNDYSGASNTTYEEFGAFRYTNISVANNPGGNAPPGSNSNPLGPNSFITYSANTDYYLNVSLASDLTSGGNIIVATNVNASLVGAYPAGFNYNPYTEINASWGVAGRPFAGAGLERMVWGNESLNPNHLLLAPNNGTTAHGPIYSNFDGYGVTEVQWWASVPAGTPEGIYQATINFIIGYY